MWKQEVECPLWIGLGLVAATHWFISCESSGLSYIHRNSSETSAWGERSPRVLAPGGFSCVSTICKQVCACEIKRERERPLVQCKSLCISREQMRVRDIQKRQDGCWLLTSVWEQRLVLGWGVNYLQGAHYKKISPCILREVPIRILQVSSHLMLHCQKSQSSTSRWLRPDSRLASPEGESCRWELS